MNFTVKSIILDIADNWGDSVLMGLRSLEFKLSSILHDIEASDISATYGPSTSSSYGVANAFITSKSKTGGSYGRSWFSKTRITNQRIICVFVSSVVFDEIVINNAHDSGSNTARGLKNVKITISTDVITDLTYDAAVSNSSVVYDSTFNQHVSSDVIDDQVLTLQENFSTALQDMKLDIEAFQDSTEDQKTDFHIAGWIKEDSKFDLAAYYQAIIDLKLDLQIFGDITKDQAIDLFLAGLMKADVKFDLSAYYQVFEDMQLDLKTLHDLAEDSKIDIHAAAEIRKDYKIDLFAAVQALEDMKLTVHLAKELIDGDAFLDIYLSDGYKLQDQFLDLLITDGIKLNDVGIDVAIVSTAPVFKAVYAMHLNSAIKDVT